MKTAMVFSATCFSRGEEKKRFGKASLVSVFLLVFLLLPCDALASISYCAGTPPGSSEQPLNDAVVGSGFGCTAAGATFETFGVTASDFSFTGLSSFPPVASYNGGRGSPDIEFTATTPAATLDFQTTGQNSGNPATCTANSWCVTPSLGDDDQSITYDAQSADIYSLSLSLGTFGGISGGGDVSLDEQFCLGSSSFNCSTSSSNYGYLVFDSGLPGAPYILCTPGPTGCTPSIVSSGVFNLPAAQTEIGIEDTIEILSAVNVSPTTYLNSFTNDFVDTPEPSTFLLVALALVPIGMLRKHLHRP